MRCVTPYQLATKKEANKLTPRLKILHWEHMGVGVVLRDAQRSLGTKAKVISKAIHSFGFEADEYCQPNVLGGFLSWARNRKFDILHNHDNLKIPRLIYASFKGRFIQHYHDPKTAKPLYNVPSLSSSPSICEKVPDSTYMPLPVDTDYFTPKNGIPFQKIRVGFSDLNLDPTKAKLIPKAELQEIEHRLSHKVKLVPQNRVVNHYTMPSYYDTIDVWVDRILDNAPINFYGWGAIECASMGIPVITQIGENEEAYIEGHPFLNVTKRSQIGNIVEWLRDEATYRCVSRKSREYAVKIHDSKIVAERCIKIYREMIE